MLIGTSCSSKATVTNTNLSLSDKKTTPETVFPLQKTESISTERISFWTSG
jgi:mannan endo-1,4-beta-mannosidase